jgi:hypothetical protein
MLDQIKFDGTADYLSAFTGELNLLSEFREKLDKIRNDAEE